MMLGLPSEFPIIRFVIIHKVDARSCRNACPICSSGPGLFTVTCRYMVFNSRSIQSCSTILVDGDGPKCDDLFDCLLAVADLYRLSSPVLDLRSSTANDVLDVWPIEG